MTLSTRLRAACAVGAVLALAACTATSADGPTPTSASTTPSASVVDPSTAPPTSPASPTASVAEPSAATMSSLDPAAQEAADRAAIEAQWVKFWDAYAAIVRTPDEQRDGLLAPLVTSPLKEKIIEVAREANSAGKDNYGTVVHRIFWELPVGGQSTAAIADCQDQANSGTIDLASGSKLTVGEPRVNLRGQLVRGSDGVWRVQTLVTLGSTGC